jgi:hypothetical protein
MSPGDHPVIPRGQLDAIARRVTEIRSRFDAVRALVGPRGKVFPLLGRIFSELDKDTHFSPALRFAPIDGQYAVFRMTYRGDDGWSWHWTVGHSTASCRST